MTDPRCPDCGAPMRVRVAQRGRTAGRQFWGCTRYPACKGSRTYVRPQVDRARTEAAERPRRDDRSPARHRRVEWRDGTLLREGWSARYSHGGARLRSAPAPDALVQRFAACWIAQEEVDSYEPADAETRRVIALVRKILQRGSAPPLHPDAERALLDFVGRNEDVRSSDMRGDVGPSLRNPPEPRADEHRGSFGPAHPVTAADLPYDSEEERRFHQEWLPAAVGPVWPEYVIPQASLDLLLSGSGARPSAYRRVDFLVSAPWTTPFVVEIDGDQHSAQAHIDEQRDRALADAGYPVVRVPVEELTRGSGPQLDQVRSLCPAPPEGPRTRQTAARSRSDLSAHRAPARPASAAPTTTAGD